MKFWKALQRTVGGGLLLPALTFSPILLGCGLAAATVSPARPAVGQGVSAPAPVVADAWFVVNYVRTKEGPRVCPPGVPMSAGLTAFCKGQVEPIPAKEYFAKACPSALLVSVTPLVKGSGSSFVFGYTDKGEAPCKLPEGALAP